MRALVLLRGRKLGAGEPGLEVEKMRVISESAAAAWRVDDGAVPATFGENRLGVVAMAQQREHAVVMRTAVGHARELRDELFVVSPVRSGRAGIARRLHARRSGQCCDADAGI